MEKRKLKIMRFKDGHGTICYKISLPTKWVSEMGLDNKEYATVTFNNNKITIKNKEESKMKKVKGNLGYYEFEKYVENFENKILKVEGVANIIKSDLDEEIPYSGGIFRREYWGKGKRGATKVRTDLLYSKTPDNIYEIWEYED